MSIGDSESGGQLVQVANQYFVSNGTLNYTASCNGKYAFQLDSYIGQSGSYTLNVSGATNDMVTFNYTGAAQTWTVPVDVSCILVEAWGAQGATVGAPGGLGGYSRSFIPVTAGQVINIYVGGAGCTNTGSGLACGGFNGGGRSRGNPRGGGGGASDIRIGGAALTDRALVAGGGGGACESSIFPGGDSGGFAGAPGGTSQPGLGGTQVMGGDGYLYNTGLCLSGSFGLGGDAGTGTCGGGGGGWYGGGSGCGGGGGSSYIDSWFGGATVAGVRSGDGMLKITYVTCCIPVVSCRNLNIMTGNIPTEIIALPPVPQMLPAQLKGIGFPCTNDAAAPGPVCNCPTGYVAIGYRADYGNGWGAAVISKYQLKCKEVMPDGMFGPNEVWTCYNGTASGTTTNVSEMAPSGQALVGFQNRMGCAIDRITGKSKPIADILANGSNAVHTTLTGVGGGGGGLQPTQLVPDGHVIIGMQTYLDPPNGIAGGYSWKYALLSDVMKAVLTITDDCDGITNTTLSKSSFNCMDEGTQNVTVTVISANCSSTSCTFSVTTNGPPSVGSCPINPTTYNALGRTSVFTAVNLGGSGTNTAVVNPGQLVNFSFNRTTTVNPGCGGCCGCITQHYVGLNDGTSNVFSSCLFSTTGGSSSAHSINFTAPTTPGVYYLNLVASWWFYCDQFGQPTYSRKANSPLAILIVGCGVTECPSDILVTTAPNVCNAVVTYPGLCVYDKTSGASIAQTTGLASGSTFPLGNTTNTFVATDAGGKKTSCSFKVTVEPYNCGQPIQVYHIDTTTNSAKIKWKAGMPCVTNYQLRLRYELSPGVWSSWSGWVNKSGPGLEHMFSGLAAGTYYHYQIRSKCGPSANSIVVNGWFHTLGVPPLKKYDDGMVDVFKKVEIAQQENIQTGEQTVVSLKTIPNPAKDYVSIFLQGFESYAKTVSMMDLLGKRVFSARVPASENDLELDLVRLNLANGAYIIHVDDGVNRKTEQLVIQR